jgi:hypothetical protein
MHGILLQSDPDHYPDRHCILRFPLLADRIHLGMPVLNGSFGTPVATFAKNN